MSIVHPSREQIADAVVRDRLPLLVASNAAPDTIVADIVEATNAALSADTELEGPRYRPLSGLLPIQIARLLVDHHGVHIRDHEQWATPARVRVPYLVENIDEDDVARVNPCDACSDKESEVRRIARLYDYGLTTADFTKIAAEIRKIAPDCLTDTVEHVDTHLS